MIVLPTVSLSSVITREGASLYQRLSDYVSSGSFNADVERHRASRLGRIVQPDVVVVTGIGRDHVEFFQSLSVVAKEHASIFADLREGGQLGRLRQIVEFL